MVPAARTGCSGTGRSVIVQLYILAERGKNAECRSVRWERGAGVLYMYLAYLINLRGEKREKKREKKEKEKKREERRRRRRTRRRRRRRRRKERRRR